MMYNWEMDSDEILLVDKPGGMSSFGVVARVRRRLSEKAGKKVKVGHTGTLDPFATGLLILVVGKGTKRAGEFSGLDKVYEAKIRLGAVSTTGDPEGEISQRQPAEFGESRFAREYQKVFLSSNSKNNSLRSDRFFECGQPDFLTGESVHSPNSAGCLCEISRVLAEFVGEIEQVPPVFSAIKVGGVRAYKLARKGVEVEMPKRVVTIYSLEVVKFEWPYLEIRAEVSSGTYIRTLAGDIGERLGCGGYVEELRRMSVGEYRVGDAEKIVD